MHTCLLFYESPSMRNSLRDLLWKLPPSKESSVFYLFCLFVFVPFLPLRTFVCSKFYSIHLRPALLQCQSGKTRILTNLLYEMHMVNSLCFYLCCQRESAKLQWQMESAFIEACAIHIRNIVSFFNPPIETQFSSKRLHIYAAIDVM